MNASFLLAPLVATVLLGGCDSRTTPATPTPAPAAETALQRATREAQELAVTTGQAAREMAQNARPVVREAGEKLKDATAGAMESLRSATDAAREKIHEATAPTPTPSQSPVIIPTPAA